LLKQELGHRRRNPDFAMPSIELERRLVKSPPEVWEELARQTTLSHWLGEIRVSIADPLHVLEWTAASASGVIELKPSGWGTRVRVQAEMNGAPAWERLQARYMLERSISAFLDDLTKNSLKRG
jgi:hypothetical protein